jgi:hypothetical protein
LRDTERIFLDKAVPAASNLGRWLAALSEVTDNGRLDGFSSAFTRTVGLEVVSAALREVRVDPAVVRVGEEATVSWDASNNPSGSTVELTIISPSASRRLPQKLPLTDTYRFVVEEPGDHVIGIEVRTPRDDPRSSFTASLVVPGVDAGVDDASYVSEGG